MLRPCKVLDLWLALSATCHMICVGSTELYSEIPGILVPWCTAAQRSYLRILLYGTQNPCLFSDSVKNLDPKCWCIRIPRPGWRDTISAFGRTCCIMACPINPKRTDFFFPTNKLFKKIRRDLERYSRFVSGDSIPPGEKLLFLLASNSLILFLMILAIVSTM